MERAVREDIGVPRNKLGNTKQVLENVKKELKEKKVIPFVQRLLEGKGRFVERERDHHGGHAQKLR